MPELDAVRGVASLGVMFYRGQRFLLTLISSGQFGVNPFFVLSGLLITDILLAWHRPGYYR